MFISFNLFLVESALKVLFWTCFGEFFLYLRFHFFISKFILVDIKGTYLQWEQESSGIERQLLSWSYDFKYSDEHEQLCSPFNKILVKLFSLL